MRILICSDIYPGLGGIARYTKELSNVLKKNHQVTILCNKEPNKEKQEIINNLSVIRVETSEIYNFMHQNKNNFDLIIVQWHPYLLSAIKYFKNVIYILPSLRSSSFKSTGILTEEGKKVIELEKQGMIKCKKLSYPSLNLKKQAEKEYGIKKGKIIPHGVNLESFKPGKQKEYESITVANLNDERKGIDLLIKTAPHSKSNFIILGSGPLRKKYEKEIQKNNLSNIKFIGKKESIEYYKKSKIYVLPSRYEAFGLVILEAMASGLPVIAFKPDNKNYITASDEIIEEGKTGFLVKDGKEMAEKIDLLLSNNKLREKMSKAARKEVEKYSWKKTADEILKFAKK